MAGTTEADRILTIVPMFHVNGVGHPVLASFYCGDHAAHAGAVYDP